MILNKGSQKLMLLVELLSLQLQLYLLQQHHDGYAQLLVVFSNDLDRRCFCYVHHVAFSDKGFNKEYAFHVRQLVLLVVDMVHSRLFLYHKL